MNIPGDWCYKGGVVCEHQRIDSPDRRFLCSGLFDGVCNKGTEYSFPPSQISKEERSHSAEETRPVGETNTTKGKINLAPIACESCGSLKHTDLPCMNGCDGDD